MMLTEAMTLSERIVPAHGYQFRVIGTNIRSPVRAEWTLAALDAVAAGYADWKGPNRLFLDTDAEIAEV